MKMDIDPKLVMLATLTVMIVSLVVVAVNGISQGVGLAMLAVFSVSIAFAALFFEEWAEGGE
jgi:hypothetical protein